MTPGEHFSPRVWPAPHIDRSENESNNNNQLEVYVNRSRSTPNQQPTYSQGDILDVKCISTNEYETNIPGKLTRL